MRLVAIEDLRYGLALAGCERCDINERLGPLVRSSARVNAEMSSVNEVRGIGAQLT